MNDSHLEIAAAFMAGDADAVRTALERRPELKAALDEPVPGGHFDQQALLIAVSKGHRAMIDVLLEAGADINVRSRWWAGGFGVLDNADPALVPFLLERGARIDAHSAARLGMRERLQALLSERPALVHARGGDGQTPLHFASTVEIAQLLLDSGADIDARDVDHESTPAQYMVRDRQDVARHLVARGCRTDILMAAALGDLARVRRHLDADPSCLRMRVSQAFFPKQDPRSGGTIYTWTLGADKTAHAVAREFGHLDILAELMQRSPAPLRLAIAGKAGDEEAVKQLLAADPGLVRILSDDERVALPDAARDNNLRAVQVMLAAGWPVDARGQHHATPLHWAAWHGNVEMARALLQHGAPVDVKGDEYDGTPLHWATFGSVHGWHPASGDYAGVVETLVAGGAVVPTLEPGVEASDAVRAVLARHQSRSG
jgi:ankyrin repeat protein